MKCKTLFNPILILSLVLASAISLVGPPIVRAASITVPDDYPTIQQAVDAASPGDTVYVRAGTYYEHVTISKALVLQGEDRQTTIVDGGSSGTVLYVSADGVSISGFTVRNGSPDGIHLYPADNCLVDDVSVLSNSVTGLLLHISTYNTVTNSIVSDNTNGINTGDQGSHHNTFQNITVHSNTTYGFVGYAGSHYTQILDSAIYDNSRGVAIGWSQNWLIENTEIFLSSNVGIYIDTGDYATVENCEIYSNTQGVRFTGYHADHHTFVRNRIHSNTEAGLMFNNDARYNVIEENEIYDNNVGVYMNESPARPSYDNTLCQNSFVNNTTHALVENSSQPNAWDCGYPSGGNYWDDYTGVDVYSGPAQDQLGSDGIGDTPYVITSTTNIDHYPLYLSPPTASLAATPDNPEVYPGDSVDVDLDIQNANDLYAAQTECTVDSAVLEPQSAIFGNFFDSVNRLVAANEVSSTLGTWLGAISQQNPAGPLSGDGLFATITYEALSPGITTITCDPLLSDRDGFTQTVSFSGASIIVLPFATISGTATYQGRLDHAGIVVTATGPVTQTDITDGDGVFTLIQLRAGTYDIRADVGSYLPNCITTTLAAGDAVALPTTRLLGGDLNDDEMINIGDATLLTANFGEPVPPADARADINTDSVVNVQDLAILAGNYEVSGCQTW